MHRHALIALVVATVSMPCAAIAAEVLPDRAPPAAPEPPASNTVEVRDIRVSIGGGPGPSRVRDDYTAGPASGQPSGTYDYHLDRRGAGIIEVNWTMGDLHRHGGLIWGAGIRAAGGKLDVAGGPAGERDLSYGRVGPSAHLDYGYAFTRCLHLEAGGLVGFGAASADWFDRDSAGILHSKKAKGAYGEVGLRAGLYGCIARHLVLGGEFELTATRSRLTADQDTPGADTLVLRARGAGFLVTAGYRF
jgi:hypothetical protein